MVYCIIHKIGAGILTLSPLLQRSTWNHSTVPTKKSKVKPINRQSAVSDAILTLKCDVLCRIQGSQKYLLVNFRP